MPLPPAPSEDLRDVPWGQGRPRFSRHLVFNLTRPEKSQLVMGPLAKAAGGYGTCQAKSPAPGGGGPAPEVFANAADPDYQKLLTLVLDAKTYLDQNKRFDMPGFRPNEPYIREMKRYGILPPGLGPADPVDPYATDRAYWQSLWYAPPAR